MIKFFKSKIGIIVIIALAVRLLFLIYGASIYFNRPDFKVDGDTGAWQHMFENLYHHGEYRIDYKSNVVDYVWYARMPGYSFFIGAFWLLFNQDKEAAYWCIILFQLLLDVLATALLYHAVLALFKNINTALIAAALYAIYPFIIVWNVVVYSESMSIFFLIVSLYLYTRSPKSTYQFWSGIFIGTAVLFRPQILVFIPFFALGLLGNIKKINFKPLLVYGLGVCLSYGLWPMRNVIFHHKLVLSQDLQSLECWQPDVMSFMHYTYTVKSEWEPQFSNIVKNETVTFPSICYQNKTDSAMLQKAIQLAKTQGAGFSQWRNYWQKPFDYPNANQQIFELFTTLRLRFIQQHPLHVYLYVPLQNLQKAIFKLHLKKNKTSPMAYMTSLLFMYRTLLILLGLFGAILLVYKRIPIGYIILASVSCMYLFLCFGTGSQFRNIEIRYFLPPDVLLIVPASFFIQWLYNRLATKNAH